MKKNIHPRYMALTVKCSCKNSFETRSTLGRETLQIEKCPKCHPFYTGVLNTEHKTGRGRSFQQKFPGFRLSQNIPASTTNSH